MNVSSFAQYSLQLLVLLIILLFNSPYYSNYRAATIGCEDPSSDIIIVIIVCFVSVPTCVCVCSAVCLYVFVCVFVGVWVHLCMYTICTCVTSEGCTPG